MNLKYKYLQSHVICALFIKIQDITLTQNPSASLQIAKVLCARTHTHTHLKNDTAYKNFDDYEEHYICVTVHVYDVVISEAGGAMNFLRLKKLQDLEAQKGEQSH